MEQVQPNNQNTEVETYKVAVANTRLGALVVEYDNNHDELIEMLVNNFLPPSKVSHRSYASREGSTNFIYLSLTITLIKNGS